MLAKNLDVQRGLVNGARGVVVGFDKKNQGTVYETQRMAAILYVNTQGIGSEGWWKCKVLDCYQLVVHFNLVTNSIFDRISSMTLLVMYILF